MNIIREQNLHLNFAYLSIKTYDNYNYILDITVSNGFEYDFDIILNFAHNEIKKRQKDFSLFVKSKKYIQNSEKFEEYLQENSTI